MFDKIKPKNKSNKISQAKADVMQKPMQIVASMQSADTDPNGSYTGVPHAASEKPVQDADDL